MLIEARLFKIERNMKNLSTLCSLSQRGGSPYGG